MHWTCSEFGEKRRMFHSLTMLAIDANRAVGLRVMNSSASAVVSVYANIARVGRTSITVHLKAWVRRRRESQSMILVTDGNFTFVAIDP